MGTCERSENICRTNRTPAREAHLCSKWRLAMRTSLLSRKRLLHCLIEMRIHVSFIHDERLLKINRARSINEKAMNWWWYFREVGHPLSTLQIVHSFGMRHGRFRMILNNGLVSLIAIAMGADIGARERAPWSLGLLWGETVYDKESSEWGRVWEEGINKYPISWLYEAKSKSYNT